MKNRPSHIASGDRPFLIRGATASSMEASSSSEMDMPVLLCTRRPSELSWAFRAS